jgi:hypothetical protein
MHMLRWLLEIITGGRIKRDAGEWTQVRGARGEPLRRPLPQDRAVRIGGTGPASTGLYGAVLWAIECAGKPGARIGDVSDAVDRVNREHREGWVEWRKMPGGPVPYLREDDLP